MNLSRIFQHRLFWGGLIILLVVLGTVFYLQRGSPDQPSPAPKPERTTAAPISPVPPVSVVSPVAVSPVSPAPVPRPLPDKLQAMLQQAIAAYENHQYDSALQIFNQILEQDKNNFLAYNGRGSVYTDLQAYDKAIADYTKVIELEPLFPHAYYNRGRVYRLMGEFDKAIADLQKAAEMSPMEFGYRAYGNIGLIYHQQGQYQNALEAFNRSIEFDDTKADVFYFRGETYTALQDYDAAISDYQAAIDRFSRYDRAYAGLAYAYYKTNRPDQAREAITQALNITPNNPATQLYLMLLRLTDDDIEGAQIAAAEAAKSIAQLNHQEREVIITRVLSELEEMAGQSPAQRQALQPLIDQVADLQ